MSLRCDKTFVLLVVLFFVACGQKGALTLPQPSQGGAIEPPAMSTSAETVPASVN